MRINCPHCKSKAIITNSSPVTDKVKDLYANCTNPDCGARFVSVVEYKYDISPSKKKIKSAIEELIMAMSPRDKLDLRNKLDVHHAS